MAKSNNAPGGFDHNVKPFDPAPLLKRLGDDYRGLEQTVERTIESASRDVPDEVTDTAGLEIVTDTIKEIVKVRKGIESFREAEKAVYLESGRAVDGYFKGLDRKLGEVQTAVDKIGDAYNQKVLAAERAERERAAKEAREREEAERKRQQEAAQRERDAQEAAERARREDTRAAHEQAAQEAAAEHDEAAANAAIAQNAMVEAEVAAAAKPADITRQRFSSGSMSTMKQEGYAEIEDMSKLDIETLRPYFKREHFEHALKAWAKITQYQTPMEGAKIGMRDKSVWR